MKPELVPAIVKEAHAKGMRVSGHVPSGMIAEDAVKDGYDEIQHVNMLMISSSAIGRRKRRRRSASPCRPRRGPTSI